MDINTTIDKLESGEYQRGEILKFEKWLERNHKGYKGAAELKKKIFEPDLGGYNLFYNYSQESAELRGRIQKELGGEFGEGLLGTLLSEAVDMLQEEFGGKIDLVELAVALRVRFVLSFSELEEIYEERCKNF